jgi:phage terminase large subunit-like protein
VVTSFRYGGRARKNNLVLIITSAGLNLSGPCYAENEKARKILNGTLTDETYFTIIYAYDERDDWKDKRLFIKANPSLGEIIRPEILENDLNDALITSSHQSDFKAKTCGIWTNETVNWIPLQMWDTERRNTPADIEEFYGQACYAGLDLSSINDFTAYTKCFKRNGLYYLFHKFYVPSEQILEKYRVENINVRECVDRGIVTAIPGPTIDYDFIKEDIVKDAERFNIVELAYDRWQANRLIDSLDEAVPKTVLIQYDQSLKQMTNPSKDFERLVMEDKIIDPNPVMKWMVTNAVVHPDVNGNYKPLKEYKSSTKRIDGVITSIVAIDRCRQNDNVSTATNFEDVLKLF